MTPPPPLDPNPLETIVAAAELLKSQGWRVVNFEQDGRSVYLRREHR